MSFIFSTILDQAAWRANKPSALYFPMWLAYGFMATKQLSYLQTLHLHSDQKEKRRQNKNLVPAKSVITYQKTTGFLQPLPHRLPLTFHLPGLGHVTTIAVKERRKLTFYGQQHYCLQSNWSSVQRKKRKWMLCRQ